VSTTRSASGSSLSTLKEAEAQEPAPVVFRPETREQDQSWDVERTEEGYEITGKRIVRMVAMTNLENTDAVRYLHKRLSRLGVIEKLREMGAEEGDIVYVGDVVFGFTDMS
jgi:GTP-binding protein